MKDYSEFLAHKLELQNRLWSLTISTTIGQFFNKVTATFKINFSKYSGGVHKDGHDFRTCCTQPSHQRELLATIGILYWLYKPSTKCFFNPTSNY